MQLLCSPSKSKSIRNNRAEPMVAATNIGPGLVRSVRMAFFRALLERIMKEIRRRTRVVGAFPDGQSCLNLAAARLRYIAGTAWSAKCYMNMRPLYQPQVPQTEAVA